MSIFKTELEAYVRSVAIRGKQLTDCESNNYLSTRCLHLNTRENVCVDRERNHTQLNPFNKKSKWFYEQSCVSVFCNEKHLSSGCRNVTDVNIRYNIVKRDNRCFVCLKKCHRPRDCHLNYPALLYINKGGNE